MRRLAALIPLTISALCLACGSSPAPQPQPPTATTTSASPPATPPVVLSVLATSDLHGYIERAVVFGGFVDNLREARSRDGGVVLIDAGDMFQGTIAVNETEGASVIRAYNAIGYNAATIGNHEFDYGPVGPPAIPTSPSDDPRGALLAAAKLARFPLLASNILSKDSGNPVQWPGVRPSTIVEVAGVEVGVVGVTTTETLETTIAGNVDELRIGPLAETINEQAHRLRQQGAKVVIVAAHAGGECKQFDAPDDVSSCKPSELFEVARSIEPGLVDVLIGAHTHQAIAHRVNGIAIIQSYAYGSAFGRVDLSVDPTSGKATVLRIHPPHSVCQEKDRKSATCTPGEYEGAPVKPSAAVQAAVADDIASASSKREQPLGVTLAATLSNDGKPSSSLGDRLTAWMLEVRPDAQVALINAGGIRTSLPAGPLTYGPFFEMFPFDNRFASSKVKVSALRKFIRTQLERGSGFSVAGVQVLATCRKDGLHVDLRHKGRLLRDDQDLVVLMSDYMAMTSRVAEAGMPKDGFTFEADPAIREALVEHLRKTGGTVPATFASPISIPGGWPISCPK
jgi:2',3'-cyclic-nucleotide 2'-phosphodiesterase (5'-nucleotidase family)